MSDRLNIRTTLGGFCVEEYVNANDAPPPSIHFCNNTVRFLYDKPPAFTVYLDRETQDVVSICVHMDGYEIADKGTPFPPQPMTWRRWLRLGFRLAVPARSTPNGRIRREDAKGPEVKP